MFPADDLTLTASGKSVADVGVAINYDLANVKLWLSANKLSLNPIKTEFLLIGPPYKINNLSVVPNVYIGDVPVKRVRETRAVGVCIDEFLSWDKHIDKITTNVSSGIGAINKLKSCVDHNTLMCAYIMHSYCHTSTIAAKFGTLLVSHFLIAHIEYKIGLLE